MRNVARKSAEAGAMEHVQLKAVTTATDEGTFTAVISTASVDRERDIVDPQGMVNALHKWHGTGKKIPLAWNHSTAPQDQIGFIDPASAKAVDGEVVVDGWIDQSVENGAHAWRLAKAGTLGFSFGYLVLGGTNRKGGGRHITELDVFEITATSTPMNNDTRVLAWKSVKDAELFAIEELKGVEDRRLTVAWTAEYLKGLPDDAFLLPQERRYAFKDATGVVDVPHLENVIALIADSEMDEGAKASLLADARATLTESKSVDVIGRGATASRRTRSVDPLRKQADDVALAFASDGASLRKPPKRVEQKSEPVPELELRDLKRRMRDEILWHLSGGTEV